MFKLVFTNSRGESIELFSSPFRLIRVEGLGDVGANIQTQKSPYQDGTTLIDTTLDERFPVIELKITGRDSIELATNRRKLSSVFNPKLGEGTLKRIADDGTHEIKVVAESVPFFPDGAGNRGSTYQKALINLRAPNPYWEDVQSTQNEMAVFVGMFEFPIEIDHELGMEFGEQGEKIIINNPSDAPAPVRIEFNGPALNPKVTNLTTGEYMLVNRMINAEQKLVLDTEFGNKRVEIHDENGMVENAFHWIDLGSTFWQLQQGDNEIQYEADVGMDTAKVLITHKNRYVGV